MTDSPDLFPPDLPRIDHTGGWQPLPRRGALLYAAATGLTLGVSIGLGLGVAVSVVFDLERLRTILVVAALVLLAGAAFGVFRHRRIGWKLDADGFATRRGGLWWSETLVPVSRVQHLDLERGPLERRLGLATLVVHTAGTRMAAVKLPLLGFADAERLREHLARQVATDDAL
ncbi:PH domain-containing protein [Pseudoxanthomonas koreensis]|uniref:PH domain-containing protein n=1 Tax=Pseudoxanthomonas koreensis TaxID=266061 RepID=UPI0035A59306